MKMKLNMNLIINKNKFADPYLNKNEDNIENFIKKYEYMISFCGAYYLSLSQL
jgi:hypothetical protein